MNIDNKMKKYLNEKLHAGKIQSNWHLTKLAEGMSDELMKFSQIVDLLWNPDVPEKIKRLYRETLRDIHKIIGNMVEYVDKNK